MYDSDLTIRDTLDEVIVYYIDNHYNPEMATMIYNLLESFSILDYNEHLDMLTMLLVNEQYHHREDINDIFYGILDSAADEVLKEHSIVLVDEVPLRIKEALIEGLVNLNYLRDYSEIVPIIEDDEKTDLEKLSEILGITSTLDDIRIHSIIDEFNPMFLDRLKEYIDERSLAEEDDLTDKAVILNKIKGYVEIIADKYPNQIIERIKNGLVLGNQFLSYVPYITKDHKDVNELAKEILTCLTISIDGVNTPLTVYKKHSDQITDDISIMRELEHTLRPMLATVFGMDSVNDTDETGEEHE